MPKKNKNRVRKIIEFGSPGQMQIISQNYCKAQLYLYKNFWVFGWIGNSPSIFFSELKNIFLHDPILSNR